MPGLLNTGSKERIGVGVVGRYTIRRAGKERKAGRVVNRGTFSEGRKGNPGTQRRAIVYWAKKKHEKKAGKGNAGGAGQGRKKRGRKR
jgi:hypothetical protein